MVVAIKFYTVLTLKLFLYKKNKDHNQLLLKN